MDYEVFILTRIREEHDAGRTTAEAVTKGLGRTGRLVTSAAPPMRVHHLAPARSNASHEPT